MATLKQLVQIQSVIDNRAIAKDTTATLENNYYYSKSKGINILKIDKVEKSLNDIQTVEIINKQKQTLKKIKRLLNE
jgi:hypothetical protein